jgi:lysophospholipase L1-like esterase
VHLSLGGSSVRIELSNQFGTESLSIGAVRIALAGAKGDITLPSANAVTFGGRPTIIIPPGAHVVSDATAINLPAQANLTISLFIPAQKISHITVHGSAYATNYIAPGNVIGDISLPPPTAGTRTTTSWFFLKAVDVMAPAKAASVVAFGDSITDGTRSSTDENKRWPDFLARRLLANKKTNNLGVLNAGIGGNRILHDVTGPSALQRFDEDVLAQSGVKYLIVLEAINDIGHAYDPTNSYDVVTADDLIFGYIQMAERAHSHGIKIYFATLTPYSGAKYMSPAGEAVRQALNRWIRTTRESDGFVDFDKATQDPANPASYLPAYDHGDHLHPGDTGYKAMGDAIDLNLFLDKK